MLSWKKYNINQNVNKTLQIKFSKIHSCKTNEYEKSTWKALLQFFNVSITWVKQIITFTLKCIVLIIYVESCKSYICKRSPPTSISKNPSKELELSSRAATIVGVVLEVLASYNTWISRSWSSIPCSTSSPSNTCWFWGATWITLGRCNESVCKASLSIGQYG